MYRQIALTAIAVFSCQLGVKAQESIPPDPPAPIETKSQPVDLISVAKSWQGTPYRYAGKDRRGVDCSHFVHQIYSQVFAGYQYRMAQEYLNDKSFVEVTTPRAGDIIVFPGSGNTSPHVGIVTDGEARKFIGSQSSTGVKETSYSAAAYWGKRPYKILAFRGAEDTNSKAVSKVKKSNSVAAKTWNKKTYKISMRSKSMFDDLAR
jgi:hypothetical protein